MLSIILAALILLTSYLFYSLYLRPLRLHSHYHKLLQGLGYKVLAYPFKPFGVPNFQALLRDQEEKKDCIYSMKHVHPKYDVILTNMISHIELIFLRHKLGQHIIGMQGVMLAPKKTQFIDLLYQMMPKGLLFINGQEWKHKRKILSNIFSFNLLESQVSNICRICDQTFDGAQAQSQKSHPGSQKLFMNMEGVGRGAFGNVVISLFLGMDSSQETIDGMPLNLALGRMNDLTLRVTYHPWVLLFGSKFVNFRFNQDCRQMLHLKEETNTVLVKYVRKYIYEFEEKKTKNETYQPSNIIEYMVQAMHGAPDLQKQLCDQVYLFVVAGVDTSGSFFTSLLYLLIDHPAVLNKLRQEIEQIIGQGDITYEKIKKMEYLHCVIQEGLRMRGPVVFLFDRYASKNMMVEDIPVNKGTLVTYSFRNNFFREQYYDDPHQFRPERWFEDRYKTPEMQAITSMNFSGGPRACIGKQLAYLQLKIGVTKFLSRYQNFKDMHERVFMIGMTGKYRHSDIELTRRK